jgi:hypothetical protein
MCAYGPFTFHSTTDDAAVARETLRSERLNRTHSKTVKHMLLAICFDAKTLVAIISAYFAFGYERFSETGGWGNNLH